MSATYDSRLATDCDMVRFLMGDTDVSHAAMQDEEISAMLATQAASGLSGEAAQCLVAADCLLALKTRWGLLSKGLQSKSVGRLSKSWGLNGSSGDVLIARAAELRQRAAGAAISKPRIFKVL